MNSSSQNLSFSYPNCGAKVLGKLPVPGRPTSLDYSKARAYCACSRCGWGCLDIFSLIYHFSFLPPSLWETARYRLKYCLKGPLSPKQPTNQLIKKQEKHLFLPIFCDSSYFVHCIFIYDLFVEIAASDSFARIVKIINGKR